MDGNSKVEELYRQISSLNKENKMLKAENINLQNNLEQYVNLVVSKEKYIIDLQQQLNNANVRISNLENMLVVKIGRKIKRTIRKIQSGVK